jgi:hypothetical protein
MRTSRLLVSVFGAIALTAVAVWWLSAAEVIKVRAVEAVPLFDPESLAGSIGDAPKQVGQLKVGEELPVLACVDRKSDTNLYAAYQGKVVAVGEWKARVQLLRSHAYPWEHGATTSCQGFFENLHACLTLRSRRSLRSLGRR